MMTLMVIPYERDEEDGKDAKGSTEATMNIYGQAMLSSESEANGKVVEMVLKPVLASA